MKRSKFVIMLVALAVAAFAVPPVFGAATQDQAAGGPMLQGAFATTLVKALDTKKLKDGDPIVVQTLATIRSNGMLLPSGSKIYGHIIQAQARSKGDSQSSLAIAFDKIEPTKGKELPMKGVLQAVAPPLPGSSGPDTSGMMGSGQMIAGHGNSDTMASPAGVSPSGVHSSNSNAGAGPHPILNNESQGVLGFKNLQMDKDHVLTSSDKEIKLDGGTQMMVRVEIQMPVQ